MNTLTKIIEDQKEFQRLLDIPVDSIAEVDILQMAELHCFKAIEEIVELRKTFPSTLNKHEKNKAEINRARVLAEFCDSLLYHINFSSVWRFTPEQVISGLQEVQRNNFIKAKEKIMGRLNAEMLRVPGEVVGIGSGSLMPKYIFVGQNPAAGITHGYEFWSDPESGSSRVLLPILEELGIHDLCYFTNIVKSTTKKNVTPSDKQTEFWLEFYLREIEILRRGADPIIIPMGKFAEKWLEMKGISHPASVQYRSITEENFRAQVAGATFQSFNPNA